MNVPRDPLAVLLGGLSLLNDGTNVTLRLQPNAGENMRWVVKVGDEGAGPSAGHGDSLLEAVTSAYRASIAELEQAVQRQVNDAVVRT